MKVMPMNSNSLDLDNLNPDINGDGKVEGWEQDIFKALKAADSNADGFLSRGELFNVIDKFSREKSTGAGILISDLNPDTDGDGKIEVWETECYEMIKSADPDKSGNISVKELFGVMRKP